MDPKELRGLMEAYQEVYAPQEEIEEASYSAKAARAGKDIGKPGKAFAKIAKEAGKRYGSKERGEKVAGAVLAKLRAEDVEIDEAVKGESSERRKALAAERKAGHRPKSAKEGENYASHKIAQMAYVKRQRMGEEVEIFDVVLEFLQAEGYAETLEEAEWLMANVIDEEAIEIILGEEQLNEISLKTKMKAYAASRDVDADYNYGDKVHSQGDRIKKAIVKKHGEKAGEHAERAAEVQNFGRGTPRAKPRIEKNRTYRTTKAGKMHGQDQAKLKSDLKYNRSSRNEEYMDEAQAARENPEKYEREQSKKTAPVRGERTPMPPRGDKRREDFEKWYAANVR